MKSEPTIPTLFPKAPPLNPCLLQRPNLPYIWLLEEPINWPTDRLFRTSNKRHPFPSLTFLSGPDLCCLWDMRWKTAGFSYSLAYSLSRQLAFLWGLSDPRTIWSVHFIPCRMYCMKLTDVVQQNKMVLIKYCVVCFCWYRILLCCSADLKHNITIACRNILVSERRRQSSRESFQPS